MKLGFSVQDVDSPNIIFGRVSKSKKTVSAIFIYNVSHFTGISTTTPFTPLDEWYRVAKTTQWKSLVEVRQFYPSADAVGNFTVFNIKGNDYRLIVHIDYQRQIAYVKYVLTHAEYDKEKWKDDPYF